MIFKKFTISVLEKMKQEFGTQADDLYIGIGPGIKKESYNLEYIDPMFHVLQRPGLIEKNSDGSFQVDLPAIIQDFLVASGVRKENIEISTINTATDKNYFSHYRDSREHTKEGRFATVLMLK